MRITAHQNVDPPFKKVYKIELDGTENPNFKTILEGWLDALEFHEMKSRDYSERDEPGGVWNLGLRGEWPGVTRKMQKLHKIIWRGKDVLFEGGQEIMMDLMGAIGLMLHEQKKVSDKYSSTWRDNHGSKPTFGPGPNPNVQAPGFINPENQNKYHNSKIDKNVWQKDEIEEPRWQFPGVMPGEFEGRAGG